MIFKIKLTSGIEFRSVPNSTILDSAANSSITLPYSCKTGRCSTCKSKLLSGITKAIYPEIGLDVDEKKEGWILSCVRVAMADLHLEVDDLNGIKLPDVKTLPCRISELKRVAPDIMIITLRLPPKLNFTFIAGQYIEVIGPNGIRRSYSIANVDFLEKNLELHIRALSTGQMSDYWFNQAKINDLLRLNGPHGTVFLRDYSNRDLIFLATGTGIAPVKSILESLYHSKTHQRPKSITLLWGARHFDDFYFNVNEIPGKFTYIPVLSRPHDNWSGAKGYVQDVLLDSEPELQNASVYAFGSDVMIRNAKIELVKSGLPAQHFYSDAFVSSGLN